MSWLQILVLGAAVGFGEIFPLSGSGISVPVRQLLGLPLDGSEDRLYSALLRIAVWLAVCLVLRRELWSCLRAFSSPPRHRGERVQEETRLHRRLALLLLLGTLPIIPALLIQDRATGLGTLPGVAVFLVLNGLLLFLTDRVGHGMRDVRSATVADGLCMGLAQALSIIPGLSRTGLTISAGILQGLEPEFSWNFSFLLAVPAMLLQSIIALFGVLGNGIPLDWSYLAGMAVAGLCAYLALRILRFVIRRNGFGSFAYASGHGPFDLHFILNLLRREATWHRRNLHPTLGPKKGKSLTPPRNGP